MLDITTEMEADLRSASPSTKPIIDVVEVRTPVRVVVGTSPVSSSKCTLKVYTSYDAFEDFDVDYGMNYEVFASTDGETWTAVDSMSLGYEEGKFTYNGVESVSRTLTVPATLMTQFRVKVSLNSQPSVNGHYATSDPVRPNASATIPSDFCKPVGDFVVMRYASDALKDVEWTKAVCDNGFSYGSATASELRFSLLKSELAKGFIKQGTKLLLKLIMGSTSKVVGAYYVDDSLTTVGTMFASITAYDAFVGKELSAHCSNVYTSPDTMIASVVSHVSKSSGVKVSSPPSTSAGNYASLKLNVGDDTGSGRKSYRDVISQIGLATASCAVMGYETRTVKDVDAMTGSVVSVSAISPLVRFVRPSTGSAISVPSSMVYQDGGFSAQSTGKSRVDHFMVQTKNTAGASVTAFEPATVDYSQMYMSFSSSDFSNSLRFAQWYKIAKLHGLEYEPFDSKFVGLPFIEPFDKLSIVDNDGMAHTVYPFSVTHTFNGAWTTMASADPFEGEVPSGTYEDGTGDSSSYDYADGSTIITGARNLLKNTVNMYTTATVQAVTGSTIDSDGALIAVKGMYEDEQGIDTLGLDKTAVFVNGSTSCLSASMPSPYTYINSSGVTSGYGNVRPLYFRRNGDNACGSQVVVARHVSLEPFANGGRKKYTFSHYWNRGTTYYEGTTPSITDGHIVASKWLVSIGAYDEITNVYQWFSVDPVRVSSYYANDEYEDVQGFTEYVRDAYTFEFPEEFVFAKGVNRLAIVMQADWDTEGDKSAYDTLSTGAWQLEEGACCSMFRNEAATSGESTDRTTATVTRAEGWTGTYLCSKRAGVVTVQFGAVHASAATTMGTTAFGQNQVATLPVGYRPAMNLYGYCGGNSTSRHAMIYIKTTGEVYLDFPNSSTAPTSGGFSGSITFVVGD